MSAARAMSTIVAFFRPCLRKQANADLMMSSRVSGAVVSEVTALPSVGRRENERARGDSCSGRNQHVLNVFDLVARGAAHLANTFGDAIHPADVAQPPPEEFGVRADRRCQSRRHQYLLSSRAAHRPFALNRKTRNRWRPSTSPF